MKAPALLYLHSGGHYSYLRERPHRGKYTRIQNTHLTGFTISPPGDHYISTGTINDPRGFSLECDARTLVELMTLGMVDRGVITTPCRYVIHQGKAHLAPQGGLMDREAEDAINRLKTSLPVEELKVGSQYITHSGRAIAWLGACHHLTWTAFPELKPVVKKSLFYLDDTGMARRYGKNLHLSGEITPDEAGYMVFGKSSPILDTIYPQYDRSRRVVGVITHHPVTNMTVNHYPRSFGEYVVNNGIIHHGATGVGRTSDGQVVNSPHPVRGLPSCLALIFTTSHSVKEYLI